MHSFKLTSIDTGTFRSSHRKLSLLPQVQHSFELSVTQPVEAACGGDGLPRMFISLGCAAGHLRMAATICRGAVVKPQDKTLSRRGCSSAKGLQTLAQPGQSYVSCLREGAGCDSLFASYLSHQAELVPS